MANLVVLVIILGCAAVQFFKGTLATAATTVIAAASAAFAAMGFQEFLAGYLNSYMGGMSAWAGVVCFILLFILVFAVLQTAITQLLSHPIDLGEWPERIGRPLCGALLGWVVAGVLLIAASLAPLPLGYPYPRFESRQPDPDRPSRLLLNADGFLNGWFGLVSRGSLCALRGQQSFSVVHAGFLDQLYLNRLVEGVPQRTENEAIEVPRKAGVWEAPEGITDGEGRSLGSRPGRTLMLVRIGFKNPPGDASPFTLSQLRVVCKPRDLAQSPLTGKGRAVYPAGFMQQARQLAVRGLQEQITLEAGDFGREETKRWIDFGFYVPTGWVPVLAQFKRNNMVEVSMPASTDEIPQVVPFERRKKAPPAEETPSDANQSAESETPGTR